MAKEPELGKIYEGDCIEVMRDWPDKCFDAIITDPPYGIGFKYNTYVDTFDNWKVLMSQAIPEWLRLSRGPIIFPSANRNGREWLWKNFHPKWTICWHKGSPGHAAAIGFNDWEDLHVMGDNIHRHVHDHFYAKPSDNIDVGHPCPKSMGYYQWLISKFTSEGDAILEPFAGSGNGIIAADNGGRKWTAIEMDSKYVANIKRRLDAEHAQGTLF